MINFQIIKFKIRGEFITLYFTKGHKGKYLMAFGSRFDILDLDNLIISLPSIKPVSHDYKVSFVDEAEYVAFDISGLCKLYSESSDDSIWQHNRHRDLETKMYISKQNMTYSKDLTFKVNNTVIYGYKALEMNDKNAVFEASELLKNLLNESGSLPEVGTVREQREHLVLSINYLQMLLFIYLNDEVLFVDSLLRSLKHIHYYFKQPNAHVSILNAIKVIMLVVLYLVKKNDFKLARKAMKYGLHISKLAFLNTNTIVLIHEFKRVISDIQILNILVETCDKQKIHKAFERQVGVTSHEAIDDLIFKAALRVNGDANLRLVKRFKGFTFNESIPFDYKQINYLDEYVDGLRKLAIEIEEWNIKGAYTLIKLCSKIRPEGPFLLRKLREYDIKFKNIRSNNDT